MPWHSPPPIFIMSVSLSCMGEGIRVHHEFVRQARKLDHVVHAFATAGRFDAVVFVSPREGDFATRYEKAAKAAEEVVRLPHVRYAETFATSSPSPGGHDKERAGETVRHTH